MAKQMSDENVALWIAGAAIAVIFWEDLPKMAITGAIVYAGTAYLKKELDKKPHLQFK